ncbi:MAG: hypothetical protein CL529_12670 [Aequorivita sp.]|nr:hypothetical protein [Aequorivita sp.]|tara:strand:+ start:22784 stop:23134 length:351 start_codon:yes stop_codon:yes gene_type:complete
MKKTRVVLFKKEGGVRIFINPPSLAKLQEQGDILVNPSIPKGIPPHEWKLINGKIKSKMTLDNVIQKDNSHEVKRVSPFKVFVIISILGLFSFRIYENKELLENNFKSFTSKIFKR